MSIVLAFTEILGILLFYNILSGEKIYKKINMLLMLSFFTTIIYMLVNKYFIFSPLVSLLSVCIVISFVIHRIVEEEFYTVVVKIMISLMLIGLDEIIAGVFVQVALREQEYIPVTSIVIGLIPVVAISMYILQYFVEKKNINFNKILPKYKSVNIVIINLVIYCLIARTFLTNNDVKKETLIKISILGVVLLLLNIYFYLFLHKTLNQRKKTEIKKSFNPLISELMSKLKNNENEYNKHIKEIYNILNSNENKEIACEKANKYIKNIAVEDKEFVKLLEIKNTIVKAVLYNKIQRAEKLGVNCEYNINSDLRYIPVDDSELTVILSNIINNAIEATSLIKKKEMKIDIYENDKKYIISVNNRTEGVSNKDIKEMFKYGYSTKGEGRGYGLYNVKNMVDKNKGKINISLKDDLLTLEIKFNKEV